MSNHHYAITDIRGYATDVRFAAAEQISKNNQENLDDYITVEQVTNLVYDHCLGFDEESRPILDEETNEEIFEAILTWIHNIGLAKLAGKGLVECAWDNETNEMIFWAKETSNNDTTHKRPTGGTNS